MHATPAPMLTVLLAALLLASCATTSIPAIAATASLPAQDHVMTTDGHTQTAARSSDENAPPPTET